MEKDIIHTLNNGERVTSTYAEIYYNDSYCNFRKSISEPKLDKFLGSNENQRKGDWQSPSDLLTGIVELKPPFTSKITRGKTHEGILAIGEGVLESEQDRFLRQLSKLIQDNDAVWSNIMEIEQKSIEKKVKLIYKKIFKTKSQIMSQEIAKFYESTLQELEDHVRREVQAVLISAHAEIISYSNIEIKSKLKKEKEKLEYILKKKYNNEIQKVKKYYKLLLNNELKRNTKLLNRAKHDRNDALKAYVEQIEAENITSTMYIMCTERKKCKIRQFMLESYQITEISEKVQKIKERQDFLNVYKEKEVRISDINKEWEEKIKKVLRLFLKFISFSLKLLPEQSTFLLDLEKMVVLQLNDIQKLPKNVSSILIEEEKLDNVFQFDVTETTETPCLNKPFVIVGDMSDSPILQHGSTETLPSDVDLPIIRLKRQFIYAKCHNYEEIKALLNSENCEYSDKILKIPSIVSLPMKTLDSEQSHYSHTPQAPESSNESMIIDDIDQLKKCPVRHCKDWSKMASFPYLDSLLDYTEENFERLKVILNPPQKDEIEPELLDPRDIVYRKLPFAATVELYHNIATQYSSQESLYMPDNDCPCTEGIRTKQTDTKYKKKESSNNFLNEILMKRKTSLMRLLQENPMLLKMFTDECFDFQL
ncbi:uncharacterized protein ACR2FA_003853 [Aphomia sociella]